MTYVFTYDENGYPFKVKEETELQGYGERSPNKKRGK
jgi:hypothetical protein